MSEDQHPRRKRGRPRSEAPERQSGTVQALDRGLRLLRLLAEEHEATLTEIAVDLDMAPSSAYRLLITLQQRGMVTFQEDSQTWAIGVESFRIGSAFLRRTNTVEAARPVMRALVEATGETSNLGIEDRGEVVFVSQVETHQPIRAFFRPGTRGHMHASGIGKALLAERSTASLRAIAAERGLSRFTDTTLTTLAALEADLQHTRQRGWALDNEESTTGMRCLAAAIFNEYGEAVAGISISGLAARLPDAALPDIGERVRSAAREVTEAIGGRPPR
ncbi:HTH-type transcriptional regulator BhcR [Sediminicurvatus halobius]|uniref:HTH-type transcriptional repressor AllR n=1 Tax=Sediminicurvatus halobius TaxID=2182432 RepID=A0A2U2N3P4_9GAMM|nr:HTH-type transcriptional regulator BhcR [Spiribacter halobius]PWG63730.1 IclR family transcriptional regulator [Spiribacter halobius]UEX76209.1 IclR family transcriptional regulator [Spiribacter halobius]